MTLRIKVCGITSERDALEAVWLGADALGFDFREGSNRAIGAAEAAAISMRLPPFVGRVGVFADQDPPRIVKTARAAGLTAIQFDGDEPPDACFRSGLPWFKSFRVGAGFDLAALGLYPCPAYRLEVEAGAGVAETEGALPAAWTSARAAAHYGRIILAGEIELEDLPEAIGFIRPYGIDIGESAEVSPGIKDIDRLERLVEIARQAGERLESERKWSR